MFVFSVLRPARKILSIVGSCQTRVRVTDVVACIGRRLSLRLVCLLLISIFSTGCATPAYQKVDKRAQELGFVRSTQGGGEFRHVVYSPSRETQGDSVHVYIEGDGVAWQWRYFIKADPTPKRALMLDLMGQDKGNTLYVGRPCYFGLAVDEQCNPNYWTYSRFSEKVVNSMATVIAHRTKDFNKVVLIGHSGGAALALLIAEKLQKAAAVVTIAGNIDTDAWISHHKYTPLFDSLNPADRAPLPASIKQLHLVGSIDRVVPPELARNWLSRQHSAEVWYVDGNTHVCCWAEQWPAVLQWIESIEDGSGFSSAAR